MLARMELIRAADEARPKRWLPSRLIVQNWWYFTRQVFHFVDGHLVLNGANGSGKSTVEALAVPVVLDMLKGRQRFDPFGGVEKHPSYYLLGLPKASPNSVGYHDARIGYVVWEFQHGETDAFVTIGVGLAAKRSDGEEPPIDSWGFVLHGQRLGYDFDITGDKEPLTRGQLEARIGREHVYRTAHEYQAAVNAALFGFERPEDLRHLTDTLVELRKPKIVKDVSADDLSSSLRNALPALPRETSERLAALIKNIDEAAEALAETQDHIRRVAQIHAAQSQYANRLAQEAALAVQLARKDLASKQRRYDGAANELLVARNKAMRVQAQLDARHSSLQAAEGTYEAKRSSEAYKSVESLDAAEQGAQQARSALGLVERAYSAAERQVTGLDAKHAGLEIEYHHAVAAIEGRIEDVREAAMDARWPEATARVDAVRVAIAESSLVVDPVEDADPRVVLDEPTFHADGRNRQEHLFRVEGALDAVAAAERERDLADQALRMARAAFASANEELGRAHDAVAAQRDHAGAALSAWVEQVGQDVRLEGALDTALEALDDVTADAIESAPVVAALQSPVREAERMWRGRADHAAREHARITQEHRTTVAVRDRLAGLEFEPPPARPGQAEARAALAAARIRAVPFYAAVDFAAAAPPDAQARIEAALEQAGLLDALVVADADRAAVERLATTGGLGPQGGDRWIAPAPRPSTESSFHGAAAATRDGWPALVAVDGMLPDGTIAEMLSIIRYDTPSGELSPVASVQGDGQWQQGALRGLANDLEGRPRYIGETNRQRRRETELARLAQVILELDLALVEQESLRDAAVSVVERLERLRAELESLPALRLLTTRAIEHRSARDAQERAEQGLREADAKAEAARSKIRYAQAALQTVLDAVAVARGCTRDQVRELREATRRTLAQCTELGRDLNALDSLREREQQLRRERADLTERLEDSMGDVRLARGEVERAVAKVDAIRELLEGQDALQIRADVMRLAGEIKTYREEILTLTNEVGAANGAAGALEKTVERLGDEQVMAERASNAAAEKLKQRLAWYPDESLTQAILCFEDVALGPDAAAAELLKRRRPGANLADNIAEDLRESANALGKLFGDQETQFALARFRPELTRDQLVLFVTVAEQQRLTPVRLLEDLRRIEEDQRKVVSEEEHRLYVDFFLNDVVAHIRRQVLEAQTFTREMNAILQQMKISNGAAFRMTWEPRQVAGVAAVDYKRLVQFVLGDPEAVTAERREAMISEFRQRVEVVRANKDARSLDAYRERLAEEFDYRSWFQFRFFFQKPRETEFELREKNTGRLSGGERTLVQVLPLLAAVHARLLSARPDALKVFALDEPFAGVDAHNIQEVLEVLVRLEFSWIFAGESFWGDSPVLSGCATYLLRSSPGVVMAMLFVWDGTQRLSEAEVRAQRELLLTAG